jgi:hypothetical protein
VVDRNGDGLGDVVVGARGEVKTFEGPALENLLSDAKDPDYLGEVFVG